MFNGNIMMLLSIHMDMVSKARLSLLMSVTVMKVLFGMSFLLLMTEVTFASKFSIS